MSVRPPDARAGKKLGSAVFTPDSKIFRREYVRKTEEYFAKHGAKTARAHSMLSRDEQRESLFLPSALPVPVEGQRSNRRMQYHRVCKQGTADWSIVQRP